MLSFSKTTKCQKGSCTNLSSVEKMTMVEAADSVTRSAASLSHKEAERRRRQRINTHLSTLRTLLPNTTKTDKASLLAEVVKHVKDLKRQFDELARQEDDTLSFPGELDEARVSCCGEEGVMKATVCCEDRPGLTRDLVKAMKSGRVKVVKAEMVTVGGRSKSVVVMKWNDGEEEEEVNDLKVALRDVVENRASGRVGLLSGKRARLVHGSGYEDDDQHQKC